MKYVVINVGCLECGNETELVGSFNTLEEAKDATVGMYNKQGSPSVLGDNYEPVYGEVQTIIIPLTK